MPPTTQPLSDGAQRLTREALMRKAMNLLAYHPMTLAGQMALVQAIESQHRRNVQMLGWAEAEALRAQTFDEVIAGPVPAGEATESDLAQLHGGTAV